MGGLSADREGVSAAMSHTVAQGGANTSSESRIIGIEAQEQATGRLLVVGRHH